MNPLIFPYIFNIIVFVPTRGSFRGGSFSKLDERKSGG